MTKREMKQELKQINRGLKEFSKVLARKKSAYQHNKKMMKAFAPLSRELKKKAELEFAAKKETARAKKIHPWRVCPENQFFRRAHSQNGYERANGVRVSGSVHPDECVINRTGKDQIYSEEMQEIAARYFGQLTGLPAANDLTYPNGNKFDSFIRGWTKYWNEVLQPKDPLDPNLVKALIATESGFKPSPKEPKKDKLKARGLMQVTNKSRKLLAGQGGVDLKDHFVHVDLKDMTDPNLNISCGVRWLFRKKEIVDSKAKNATWIDAVMAYKGYSSLNDPQMIKFLDRYKTLKNSK